MISHFFPKKMTNFDELRVTVFGLGVSGLAATELLVFLGSKVSVVDQGPAANWKNFVRVKELVGEENCHSQDEASAILASSELIILSPGIPVTHPVLAEATAKRVPLWSEIELGYQFAVVPILCVTGTNGKTTTVSLLGDMFEKAGLSVFVGGNIGTPFCKYALEQLRDKKNYSYIVLEISSFQLETIHQFRPHVAVITNIAHNHEERYPSLESYAKAKFQVVRNMGEKDVLIYPQENLLIDDWAQDQRPQLIPFYKEIVLNELSEEFDLRSFSLSGWHNWENLYCAKMAFEQVQEDLTPVQKTIDTFKGVPHRLEKVETSKPYLVYNDAKSTNVAATLTAIKTLMKDAQGKEIYLIFGGMKREDHALGVYDWPLLFNGVAKIFLIGETCDDLFSSLGKEFPMVKCYSLEKVIQEVDQSGFRGILLLSPGFPSFDQFHNYAHRGDCFKALFKS